MIDLTEVKKIVLDEVENSKALVDYFECYISNNRSHNVRESIMESLIRFHICTHYEETEIAGNFCTELELRCLIRRMLGFHIQERNNVHDKDTVSNFKIPNSEYNVAEGATKICISKMFFNSKKICKCATNHYFIDCDYGRYSLFGRKRLEELNQDLSEEEKWLKNAINRNGAKIWITAPRIVHRIVSNTFSNLIYKGDDKLIDLYLDSFNVNISFGNMPNSRESICNDSFDIYGVDYSDKIYISNRCYQGLEDCDLRYEIKNGRIKKGFQFSKLEMDSYLVNMEECLFFYDFIGKVDIFSNYICGKLIGENVEKVVETKLSNFFSYILGACGKMTNVLYIYAGTVPYVAVREL